MTRPFAEWTGPEQPLSSPTTCPTALINTPNGNPTGCFNYFGAQTKSTVGKRFLTRRSQAQKSKRLSRPPWCSFSPVELASGAWRVPLESPAQQKAGSHCRRPGHTRPVDQGRSTERDPVSRSVPTRRQERASRNSSPWCVHAFSVDVQYVSLLITSPPLRVLNWR